MFLKRNTRLLVLLLCSLTLWCQSTSAGSSFLSPSHKPPNKVKPQRAGRQITEEPSPPTEDHRITVSAPFEIGITMTPEDLEESGVLLQEIVQRLLGEKEAAERPS